MPAIESALVTGAAGFIGGRLMERLRSDGAEVAGIDMQTDKGRGIVAGDLSEPGSWQRAVERADVAFHAAAAVTNNASHDLAWRMNVRATRNAIDAAKHAGATRFVHFSSVRAFSDTEFPDGVDERHPVRPDGNTYVDTKIASEQVALQAHAAGEIEVAIVRPGDVYGPGSRPWTILPVEAIRANRFALPAGGEGVFSPAYIDNLIDGVVLAGSKPEAAGEVFTLTDGIGVPTREFFGHYYRMLGRDGPPTLPTAPALGLATANSLAHRITGKPTEVNAAAIRYLTRTGTYSIAKARAVLGYEPAVDLAEGMRRTEEWLREHGLLGPAPAAAPAREPVHG